ncbi:uncharacterized protein P884DRAFT_260925 [Thermothelomyces heterothallicus CBS 202.75]|uniref:uncharacterized protein n=1 Tax=Thermothelomyces heterothallicus CBS 202.75 TaxID=1149848 RepID=UPI0037427910
MIIGKPSLLRPSARLTSRFSRPSSLGQIAGRRGYASLQERIAESSETPWQVAAVAVTVPGLLYLRNKRGDAQPRHGGEVHAQSSEPASKEHKSATSIKPDTTAKVKEGIQETQNVNPASSSSSSDVEDSPTPPESSSTEALAATSQTNSSPEQADEGANSQGP